MTTNLIPCGSDGSAKLVTLRKVLAKARPMGAADRGVEFTPELVRLLLAGAPVAIGVSGGKDSVAAALATIEFLDGLGHTGPRILIHADLGDPDPRFDVEWADSLPTCRRLADRLGLELVIARRPAGGMMKRWLKRWENNKRRYANLSCVRVILPWSTPKMRFCTSELKSAPMASALVKRFPGKTIISACGVRRAESPDRSLSATTKVNSRLTNKARATTGLDWNPIAHWTEDDVYAYCASRDFDLHEGYTAHGMSRISCRFCIMSKIADLKASAALPAHWPLLRTMASLEIESTFAFQGSRWLSDVNPAAIDADTLGKLADAKLRGERREAIEARIPKHLLFKKGWPEVMPTDEEAALLCEVRREVAELLRLEVAFTEPAALRARYAELMAENARRLADKTAKAGRKTARAAKRTKAAA